MNAREIIVAALRRMSRAGESHEMAARWIMEDLDREKLYDRLLANGNISRAYHDAEVGSLIEDGSKPVRFRIARNKWNISEPPWAGAIGIEDLGDGCLAVPALVCWFTRGADELLPQMAVDLLNEACKR